MAVYLIGFDLRQGTEADRANMIEAIKTVSAGNLWNCLDSMWLIAHPGPIGTVYNALTPHLRHPGEPDGDRLLVATMAQGAVWSRSFPKECEDWMFANL